MASWGAQVLIPQNVALRDLVQALENLRPQLLLLGKRRDHSKFQELGMPRSAKGKAQREKALGVECGQLYAAVTSQT